MSKLNEFMGDSSFLNLIEYINTNESDKVETLYYWLIGMYGNRTVSSLVEAFTESHTQAIADVINNKYSEKWGAIKAVFNGDIPITSKTDSETVTEINTIFGYNESDGVADFKNVKTYDKSIMFDDVFDAIEKSIDIRDKLNYYYTMVRDIAHELTTPIYESEDD